MANQPLPDWYTPEEAPLVAPNAAGPAAPAQAAPAAPLPSWYAPEQVTVTANKPESFGDDLGDLAANVATGVARVPGAIVGVPHTIAHTLDWLAAKIANLTDDGNRTGADLDQSNPLAQHTLSSEDVDKGVFKGVSAVAGRDVQPYEPTSLIGRLLQAGVTGAGAGLIDPLALVGAVKGGATGGAALKGALEGAGTRTAKMALASDAAEATQDAFPDQPGLAAGAALLAHGGAGVGAKAATSAYRTFAEPLVRPVKAGEVKAGSALAPVDHTQPGLANPSQSDITDAANNTRDAVNDIGNGLDDYTAGGNIRNDLQVRKNKLVADRSAAADKAFGEFRTQAMALPGSELAPFMSSPTFRRAIRSAADSVLDRGDKPLTDYFMFRPEDNGEPTIVPNASVPTDVLARVREKLGDALSQAKGSDKDAIGTLVKRFDDAMKARYPQTYAPTRAEFAANSAPINQMEEGTVGRVLDGETRYGRQTYTMPQDKIANTFLQSKALKTDFDALIQAYGGNKDAALSNLEENMANKVQGAINGDGTLSLDAFNRSVRPYTKALSMWFPNLAQKFSTAEAAQKTLETLRTQKDLASDVSSGALRSEDGFVTKSGLTKWLDRNEAKLASTQSKGAVMRLRQIASALPENPGAGPEAAIESAPMVVGGALGGLEGGVLGGITHKIPAFIAEPRLKAYRQAYSNAIERAVTNPIEAQKLVALAAKRGGKQSIAQVLRDQATKAALAVPLAVNAGGAN